MDSFLSLPCVSSAARLFVFIFSALHRRHLDARLGAFLRTRPSELNGQAGFNFAHSEQTHHRGERERDRAPDCAAGGERKMGFDGRTGIY
jgi:hypothetical protein